MQVREPNVYGKRLMRTVQDQCLIGDLNTLYYSVSCTSILVSRGMRTCYILLVSKLTRNKNARHIFPRHFFSKAMIGIICLYMHFVLYIFHTRSLVFKYLYYFRSYNNHCTKCTCTSCVPTTMRFGVKSSV